MHEAFILAFFLVGLALFYVLAFLLSRRAGDPKRKAGPGSNETVGLVGPPSQYRGPIYRGPNHQRRLRH